MKDVRVMLDNIRSAHNVGSIFRTADAAGVRCIYLSGITPTPVDRFGREQPEIEKTSLGATKSMLWEQIVDDNPLATSASLKKIQELRTDGFTVIAIEQSKDSISLYDLLPSEKVLYIFGAEVEGVQPEILNMSDQIVEIPMLGKKESLNVSVTVGVTLFTHLKK